MEKKKLKIALLSFYSGVVYRGVETYVHELANKLIALGHDITVYQNGKKLPGAKYKTISTNIPFSQTRQGNVGFLFNSLNRIWTVKKFTSKVLGQMNVSTDVVVATNNRFQVVLCRLWTRKHGIKMVIPGQSGPGLDERIALWSFPDMFVPLSGHQRAWAKKINPCVKVSEVIHNGVDLDKFSRGVKPLKFDLSRPIILCAAAFWPMKRLHLLIHAVAKVNDASLLLVGAGEYKNQLNKLGKKLLGSRFLITSFPHSQMPSVYTACDLFSYPTSSWESFGIVLVEAMASGLPVVATDDPIRREVVGDAGLFVDPTDVDAYSKAFARALKINWGDKPRKQAEKFSWDKIAEQYEQLFLDLTK